MDSQHHHLQCALLRDKQVAQLADVPEYHELFSTHGEKQIAVAKVLAERFKKWEELLNQHHIENYQIMNCNEVNMLCVIYI